jgi:hypothetical protein
MFSSVPTYFILTPWSRDLLQKLTGFQLIKKLPAIYGTRRFITVFTSARHMSLSWANSIQSILPHPTPWRSILAFPTRISYSFFHVLAIYVLHSQTINLHGHCSRILPNQMRCVTFCNVMFLHGKGLLSAPPSLFVEIYHSFAVSGRLFNIFALRKTHTL